MSDRPQKITFAEMRDMGVRGILVYCADYRCSHSIAVSAHQWRDDLRLSDIEHRFICAACSKRGVVLGNPGLGKMVTEATAARDADLRPILEAMRGQPLRAIAEELTHRGIKTPRGGDTWNQVTVMRSMRRLGIRGK